MGPRRGVCMKMNARDDAGCGIEDEDLAALERFDLIHRTLVALMYNFVPRSGHPGGSVSAGRIMQALLFVTMDTDVARPALLDQDCMVLGAGHKAMGLYALLALQDEVLCQAMPALIPTGSRERLRLEDLLGFRRNPTQDTPLFLRYSSRALDGHPTPATPTVHVATGPSGVGLAMGVGLALGLADCHGEHSPRVHVIEGEGGLTPGRVSEAMACASASELRNLVLHVDFNQATIDSNRCCRSGRTPGDYVQWDPAELAYLNDFNVIEVDDGFDLRLIVRAQRAAMEPPGTQPTCIVYRTVKGWRYGIEGKASHGAGHAFCSPAFYKALEPFEQTFGILFDRFDEEATTARLVEQAYMDSLLVVRRALAGDGDTTRRIAAFVERSRARLAQRRRDPRPDAPRLARMYEDPDVMSSRTPDALFLAPGTSIALREQLGRSLGHLDRISSGAILGAAADLLDSTSLSLLGEGHEHGFFAATSRPGSRLVSAGGICEDAMAGVMAGVSSTGERMGVASSYAAFLAPLSHIAARCHAIGQQARREVTGEPANPVLMIMGHASLKTGEDGPTHADPQPLQMYQENFPQGSCITLTPWEPSEVWPLLSAAIRARPAVVAAFVTRPAEVVPDRVTLGIPPAELSTQGVVRVRRAHQGHPGRAVAVVIQGSGVATEFFLGVLPELDASGLALDVILVTSVELYDRLEPEQRRAIVEPGLTDRAMGITDFTLPTLYRFVTSAEGREASLHPFRQGAYLGSGRADRVLAQAGLDAASQLRTVLQWAEKGR